MAYEFTKLADVPALEAVPEGANAFIEVDGEVRRVPGDGLGGGGGGTTTFYYKSASSVDGFDIYAGIDDETLMLSDTFFAAAQQGPINLHPHANAGILTVYLNIDVQFSPLDSAAYSPGLKTDLFFADSERPEPGPPAS